MLKLIYFYCPDIRGFDDSEFNFSSKYNITFEDNKVSVSIGDDNYIDGFFGSTNEVNAIVGNNGSGKSSLLKRIYSILQTNVNLLIEDKEKIFLTIFEEVKDGHTSIIIIVSGKIHRYYKKNVCGTNTVEFCIDLLDETIEVNSYEQLSQLDSDILYNIKYIDFELLVNLKNVYITQVLDSEMYNEHSANETNMSMGAMIKAGFPIDLKNQSEVVQYFNKVFQDHLDFLYEYCFNEKTDKIELPFDINNYVKVRFNYNLREAFNSLLNSTEYKKLDENSIIFNHYLVNLKARITEHLGSNQFMPYVDFVEALLSSYLIDISGIKDLDNERPIFSTIVSNPYGDSDGLFEFVRFCIEKYLVTSIDDDETEEEENKDIYERFESFLYGIDYEMCRQLGKDNVVYLETVDISERYRVYLSTLEEKYRLKEYSWPNVNDKYLLIPMEKNTCDDNSLKCSIKDFYDDYKKISRTSMFLTFDYGLSSGESAMLDLFCKFHKIYNTIGLDKIKIENVILLIDEADMLFHPQWQQDYIEETINVINQIFKGINGVQTIISTHSPIMLSDVPRQNIIYLKREDKNTRTRIVPREKSNETFGANIFRLFQDAFFLDKTGIGSYAEKKMKELLKDIHSLNMDTSEEDKHKINLRINAIGDPYLKRNFELEYFKFLREAQPNKNSENEWRDYLTKQLDILDNKEKQ